MVLYSKDVPSGEAQRVENVSPLDYSCEQQSTKVNYT